MSVRKALVQIGGLIKELPASDTLFGAATLISGSASFAFPTAGLAEDSFVVVTISNATITNALFKSFSYVPQVSTDHDSLDDFQWDALDFNIENIIDNTSFDIRANAGNSTWGTYNINYSILT